MSRGFAFELDKDDRKYLKLFDLSLRLMIKPALIYYESERRVHECIDPWWTNGTIYIL